jgi:hypothetical protein
MCLGEDLADDGELVALVPSGLHRRGEGGDLLGSGGREVGGRRDQRTEADPAESGQESDAAPHRGELAGVSGHPGELVGARAVEQDQSGDMFGVTRGIGHRVGAASGVADQEVRAPLPGLAKQGVQVLGRLIAVERRCGVLAPTLSGAVVGADPGGLGDRASDPGPRGGDLTEPVGKHHGREAVATAVEVEPMAADVVELSRDGRFGITGQRKVAVDGSDRRECQQRDNRGEHPACLSGH